MAQSRAVRLFTQPIAHRGLHDREAGIIENSSEAVSQAIAFGYGVEVDAQVTADGYAVVFHDDDLDRLTSESGPVAARTLAQLTAIPLKDSTTSNRIWRLETLLELVGGRVPLIVELKSRWNGDRQLARHVADTLALYRGAVGVKSFDPTQVAAVRKAAPLVLRGMIGCSFRAEDWGFLPPFRRWRLRNLVNWPRTAPDFLSWDISDLPNRPTSLAHAMFGTPVMAWTVRSPEQQARAAVQADQMIFEGFRPTLGV